MVPRARSQRNEEGNPIFILFVLILGACYFVYRWIVANWSTLVFVSEMIIAIAAICIIFYAVYYFYKADKIKEERETERLKAEENENVQKSEYENPENIIQNEQEGPTRKEIEVKPALHYQIIESIDKFQPTRKWGNEDSYHKELLGWMKQPFPQIKYELQTGSSRPDLVIANIAIEIKGPTDDNALNTLATKILKYSHYYDIIIIVLFEPMFSERNYREIKKGIEMTYSHVYVIRK